MRKSDNVRRRSTPTKKRSIECYNKKINKITNWYAKLIQSRKDNKRKELLPLQHYIDKIKKPITK